MQKSSFSLKKEGMLRKNLAPTWSQNGTNIFQVDYSVQPILCSQDHVEHGLWTQLELGLFFSIY